jgi:hypothetical protein
MLDFVHFYEVRLIYTTFREFCTPTIKASDSFFIIHYFKIIDKGWVRSSLLKTWVEPTSETSCISNIPQTMDNVQQYGYRRKLGAFPRWLPVKAVHCWPELHAAFLMVNNFCQSFSNCNLCVMDKVKYAAREQKYMYTSMVNYSLIQEHW